MGVSSTATAALAMSYRMSNRASITFLALSSTRSAMMAMSSLRMSTTGMLSKLAASSCSCEIVSPIVSPSLSRACSSTTIGLGDGSIGGAGLICAVSCALLW